MQTTHTDHLIESLRGMTAIIADRAIQTQKSRDDAELAADHLYAELLWLGMTPAEIAAAVPGVEVYA